MTCEKVAKTELLKHRVAIPEGAALDGAATKLQLEGQGVAIH